MASRYWVGGTATWDATAGSKWALTSGGAGGQAVPTAADDVFFDATSGAATITIDATAGVNCKNFDCTGFTGTWSLSTGQSMTVWGTVFKLVPGMTYTQSNGSTLVFWSNASTAITTGGKSMGHVNFGTTGAVGPFVLQDSWASVGATQLVQLVLGTLDTNGQTITWGIFASNNSNARTLTLGASAITITGGAGAFSITPVTNMTITANTATITCSGSNFTGFAGGTLNFNGTSVVITGSGQSQWTGNNTFANFTRTGTAAKTDGLTLVGSNFTITGTLTLTGNSATNRALIQSNTVGTARTITAAAVSLTNVDFMDITGAGAAAPFTGTSLGNCLGNSGITFTAPATQTHTASAGGNWSDITKWTSRVPLPQDNVVVDVNTTGTLTADMPRLGADLTFTGFAGTVSRTIDATFYGSIVRGAATSLTSGGATFWTGAGRSSHTVDMNGGTWVGPSFRITAPGGTYTLLSAISCNNSIYITNGTFTTNGYSVTAWTVQFTGGTRVLNMGASTFTLNTTSGTCWNADITGGTINAGTSTIVISAASTLTRTFAGAGFTYGTLTYTVANSPGSLTITGANTFGTLNVGSGRILTMPSATSNTVTGTFNVNGAVNGYVYLPGVAPNRPDAPSIAAYNITGDIEIVVRVALDNWALGTQQCLIARDAANRLYELLVQSDGKLNLTWFTATVASQKVSTVTLPSVGIANGTAYWLKATLRVDNGAAGNDVKFWWAADAASEPGSWTQLGATVTTAGVTSIDTGTVALELGARANQGDLYSIGKFYRFILRNGIGGTTVFDADFSLKTVGANSFVESSANAATVTINGTMAQAGDGRVSLVSSTPASAATLFKSSGTVNCDYLSIQDSTATGGAGWYAGMHSVNVSGNTGWTFGTPPDGSFFLVW